ncbi:NUDIX domain-containing protein [Flavobacteriaceae bacterium F89]|uniref:NUDIX domain-containing protein n=1 Tax=Cerina litoralis TaxID=2874477 RepID=A0AAE3JPU4_9FLAO|nr:NUDIX domain-containing protein [Cerina litoralis]MCG2462480.1 NUDIX domain-containing protein [Cerina litoralis]
MNKKCTTDPDRSYKQPEFDLDKYIPGHSVDCVIVGYENQQLKILLVKWKLGGPWALPGGFVGRDQDLEAAAHQVLEERTGLKSIFLQQFHTFGRSDRHSRFKEQMDQVKAISQQLGTMDLKFSKWASQRFISTGYFALTEIKKTCPKPDFLSEKCEWVSLEKLPELIFDHNKIVDKTLKHLRIQLNFLPIGISLMPHKFTMQDLQKLYEAILQRPLERSNFQRKILKLGMLHRNGKLLTGAANKAPYLYSFNLEKYNSMVENGIGFSYLGDKIL